MNGREFVTTTPAEYAARMASEARATSSTRTTLLAVGTLLVLAGGLVVVNASAAVPPVILALTLAVLGDRRQRRVERHQVAVDLLTDDREYPATAKLTVVATRLLNVPAAVLAMVHLDAVVADLTVTVTPATTTWLGATAAVVLLNVAAELLYTRGRSANSLITAATCAVLATVVGAPFVNGGAVVFTNVGSTAVASVLYGLAWFTGRSLWLLVENLDRLTIEVDRRLAYGRPKNLH